MRWYEVLEIASRAEAVGIDSVWVRDGLLPRHDSGTEPSGPWEAWSLLSALAATTNMVEIGTLALAVTERNPALLAKMAVTVGEISGSRLELGLGLGWSSSESDAFGYPIDRRARRFEEAIRIVTGLLQGQRLTFEGTYHRVRDCEMRPPSPTLGGPPVVITAPGPGMARLAALYADTWDGGYIDDTLHICNARARMEVIDAACDAVGRDPGSMLRAVSIMVELPGHSHRNDHWLARRNAARATPEELAGLLLAYADEGYSRVQIGLSPCTPESVEYVGETLEILHRAWLDAA